MSAHEAITWDYPLSDNEIAMCMSRMADFARYVFGPVRSNTTTVNKSSALYNTASFYELTRKTVTTKGDKFVFIDLGIFIPDDIYEEVSDENENITYEGRFIDLNANYFDDILTVNHCLGRISLDDLCDVDAERFIHLDDEPLDPASVGGVTMLTDFMSVVGTILDQQ